VTADEFLTRHFGDSDQATHLDKREAVQPPAINQVQHLANFAGQFLRAPEIRLAGTSHVLL